MEVDGQNEALGRIAAGDPVQDGTWLDLRADIIARLDKISKADLKHKITHDGFPIPRLPTTQPASTTQQTLLSSDQTSSQEANKENEHIEAPKEQAAPDNGVLPKQIEDMLLGIKKHLETFSTYAPHTIQRLAELVLRPNAHYKALTSYLHAVDRVVRVTSGTNIYPLPPVVPDMSAMELNGDDERDPAATVSWSNPTVAALGTDESLGGALLTPIPWLTRRSPEGNPDTPNSGTGGAGVQIHSEGIETIDGPNGMGRIETVSVSVNGIPSTGHARGVTQGELLRQEQRAGVVPVSQLNRGSPGSPGAEDRDLDDEYDEVPHARGPEEIGPEDTGPQDDSSPSYGGEDGVMMQEIDVEAAVGRKHGADHQRQQQQQQQQADVPVPHPTVDDDASSTSSAESTGTKREAEQELEAGAVKRIKEDDDSSHDVAADAVTAPTEAANTADAGSSTGDTTAAKAPEDDAAKVTEED